MSKSNMFAALANDSDSEEEMKVVQAKKHTETKDKKKKAPKDDVKLSSNARYDDDEEGYSKNRAGKPYRGRGARGRGERGRGRGDRSRGGRGGRGQYRGDYQGRGGRGGRGYYRGPRDTYSHLASRPQEEGEEVEKPHYSSYNEGGHRHHRDFEKKSGTGFGKEVKKGGAGKGGWGSEGLDKKLEHMDAEDAVEVAENPIEEDTKPEEKKAEPQTEVEHEEEEEEVNNYTYAEYVADKQKEKEKLTKAHARAPEAITVKNIKKYEKDEDSKKQPESKIKKHEAYAPGAFDAGVELGFQAEPVEEEDFYGKPRGGRGGYKGSYGRGDKPHQAEKKTGGKKRFAALDKDFPAL